MSRHFQFMVKEQLYRNARNTIQRIQATLNLDNIALSDFLETSKSELEKFQTGGDQLTLKAFTSLAENLNLNLEDIYHGRIDYGILDANFNRGALSMPEKYSVGAGSRFWTVLNILNYVERNYGWHMRLQALRHFQLSERFLVNPDRAVNFRFMTDLFAYLDSKVMPGQEFFYTGQKIAETFQKPEIIKELKEQNKIKHVYESFFEKTVKCIDKNYLHKIDYIDDESCEIRTVLNQDIGDSLHWKNPGSVNTCTYRAGVISSVPRYLGLPYAKVRKISCVHRGDCSCKFLIQFPVSSAKSLQEKYSH